MSVFSAMRSAVARKAAPTALHGVSDRGWLTLFGDRELGDWQRDINLPHDSIIANWTIFACMTLIAGDMGKMSVDLQELDGGIWQVKQIPAFSPVLRKPNGYQTWQKFVESWIFSKLSRGNAYVLKERDGRGVVTAMHVLDPRRVTPLLAASGDVYYQLQDDELAQVPVGLPAAPAAEVIHDRMWCIFHPLVGLSPIFAAGLAATQGLKIQQNSARFFANMSRPSGVLTAPESISDETAGRLKREWESNYGGDKVGKVAVLGDGLKYEQMSVTAVDAQMAEQAELSAMMICSAFHVPPYKVHVKDIPQRTTFEDLNQIYHSDCIQVLMTAIESLLTEGLGLDAIGGKRSLRVHFDIDDLVRMDTAAQISTLNDSIKGGWLAPNEARAMRNMAAARGGDSPMLQQQNYSLEALAKRDAKDDPFASAAPGAGKPPAANDDEGADAASKALASAGDMLTLLNTVQKGLAHA